MIQALNYFKYEELEIFILVFYSSESQLISFYFYLFEFFIISLQMVLFILLFFYSGNYLYFNFMSLLILTFYMFMG